MSTFGSRLKALRQSKGLTGVELGEILNVSNKTISTWENNTREPNQEMTATIAEYFNVTTDYLLGSGVRIPILGSIVAGIPNTAVADYDEWIEISQSLAMRGEYFALRIKGDSMEPTLFDSDIVVIRQQPDIEDGEIAAVSIAGNEATIKRIYHRSDGIDIVGDNVRAFPRMFYSNHDIASLPVRIMGKAVEVRRDL